MAKGVDRKKARQEGLTQLGKDLTRRSHAHCELCGHGGTGLEAMEVAPLPDKPALERTIFICNQCQEAMSPKSLTAQYWRFLETAIWSDLPPAQVTAVRLTRKLSDQGENWATTLLESLYLEPAIKAWLDTES